jgi:hypothetical protein
MGLKPGEFAHWFYPRSYDPCIHRSTCDGQSNSGYDAQPLTLLHIRFGPESVFRTRRLRGSVTIAA